MANVNENLEEVGRKSFCAVLFTAVWEYFTPENEEQVSHVTSLGSGGNPTEEALCSRPPISETPARRGRGC